MIALPLEDYLALGAIVFAGSQDRVDKEIFMELYLLLKNVYVVALYLLQTITILRIYTIKLSLSLKVLCGLVMIIKPKLL